MALSRSASARLVDSVLTCELWLTIRYRSYFSIPQFLIVNDFQHINGLSFVSSASMPALLTVCASEGMNILHSTPLVLAALQESIILDHVDCIMIPSHPTLPIIHIYIRSSSSNAPATNLLHPVSVATILTLTSKPSNPSSNLLREAVWRDWDVEAEETVLQEVGGGGGTGDDGYEGKEVEGTGDG